MFRRVVLVLVALLTAAPAIVFGQSSTSTLSGVVTDTSGGAIPGATIRIVNQATNTSNDFVSDRHGAYQSEPLAPGRYRVDVTLDGFEPASREVVIDLGQVAAADFTLEPARLSEAVVVTARRVEETVQEVPIPVSVVSGNLMADAGAFNVNRLKEMIPTVQFYSTNPRNSSVNVRGLGAPFGLTNVGIEPGVGLYIDGVFYSRAAAATLDFLDVERVEVLRGPQGTLFGKNTTAGAIHVTTKKPTFAQETDVEVNYGNFGFAQGRASISGPLADKIAGRLSFSGTTRQGMVRNVVTGSDLNGLNNVGVRGQVLFAPSDRTAVTLALDHTRQRPEGYTQVVAGVAPTLRNSNREYAQIAADLGYTAPSFNAFDRLTDIDAIARRSRRARARLAISSSTATHW